MPIYEYRCLDCNNEMEVMQKFSDEPLSTCPQCGGQLKKLISNSSFILKGTGWYKTDYASPERKKAMEAEKSSGNGKSAKKENSSEKVKN
ncbi:MAG TPA: zinc ribbon domain-containing protein [Nitrospirae bacterium]|nr:zinc ribbon domain-containing protein [Nitrospirota bacterium]